MHHSLFVGHFAPDSQKGFVVKKPLDIASVLGVLREFCDKSSNGDLCLSKVGDPPLPNGIAVLGRIEEEAVFYKDGFLLCPWFGRTLYNKTSVDFMIRMAEQEGCVFYSQDDGGYMNKEDLQLWVRELPQVVEQVQARRNEEVARSSR